MIKAVTALIAAIVFRRLSGRVKGLAPRILASGVCGEIFMALGYFVYSAIFLSYGIGAAVEIPGNLAQGAAGIAVAAVLTPALLKSHEIQEILDKLN